MDVARLEEVTRALSTPSEKRFARACWQAFVNKEAGRSSRIPDPMRYGLGAGRSLGILLAVFRASGLDEEA